MSDTLNKPTTRRSFLRSGATAAFAAGLVTACKADSASQAAAAQAPKGQTGGTMGPHDTMSGATALSTADAMDAMHEKAMKAFPAKTAGKGNQLLTPRIDKGVKVFEITAKKIQWETEPG